MKNNKQLDNANIGGFECISMDFRKQKGWDYE